MKQLEVNINEIEINVKNKNIIDFCSGNNELNAGYRTWINFVKVQKNNVHAGSYIVVNRLKNHFFKLLNIFWVNVISQTEVHRTESLLCCNWGTYWKAAKMWLTRCWSNYSRVWFMLEVCHCVLEYINLLTLIGTVKNRLMSQNFSTIRNAIHQTALIIIIAYHCCQQHTKFGQPSSVVVNCHI